MIRFQCSSCDKILTAREDRAGRKGRCPTCMSRFIIPGAPAEDAFEEPIEPKTRIADDEEEQPRRRPFAANEEDDDPPPRRNRYADDDDDFEEPRQPKKKKKRTKKKASSAVFAGLDQYQLVLAGVALAGFLFIGLGLAVRPAAFVALAIGFIAMFAGAIWFIVVAFQDSPLSGVLVLVCGIYSIVYFFMNITETWKPVVLQLVGTVIYFIAAVVALPGAK